MAIKLLNSTYDEVRALSIRVRATRLDAIRTRESTSERLIEHVCGCFACLMVVIQQRAPLCDAGCAECEALLREHGVDASRSPLAHVHVTEEMIEEYCFNRLSAMETRVLEAHLSMCGECAGRVEHRRQFIGCLKSALMRAQSGRPRGVVGVFAFDEGTQETSEVQVSELRGGA